MLSAIHIQVTTTNLTDAVLTHVLSAILTGLVLWWVARKFPARTLDPNGPSLGELKPRYRKWHAILGLMNFLGFLVFAVVVFFSLHFIARWHARSLQDDPTAFVLYAGRLFLLIPAASMGIIFSWYLKVFLAKAILKECYADYERYTMLVSRHGYDPKRVGKYFSVIFTYLSVTFVWMLLDAYVVASPGGLRINTFLGVEKRRNYTEIASISTAPSFTAPSGDIVFRRGYVIKFKDGSALSSDSVLGDEIDGRSYRALIEFISKQSGVPLQEKELFERGEL